MSNVVWSNTVDGGKFACKVTRISERTGLLSVTVVDSGEVLLDVETALAWGAIFGPDIADVIEWETLCIKVIDEWIANAN